MRKNNIAKRLLSLALAVTMIGSGAVFFADKNSDIKAYASTTNAPSIEEIEYEKGGKVEVEFYGKVKYNNVKVTVEKLSTGKKYTAQVIKKDSDDITFKSPSYSQGCKYKFTISGIKKSTSSKYTKVSGYFTVPKKTAIKIDEIEYDREDNELSFDFATKVNWKSPTVKITNESGTVVYKSRIVEKDSDELELRLSSKLTYGKKYKYTITGIKAKTAANYRTLSGTFVARR